MNYKIKIVLLSFIAVGIFSSFLIFKISNDPLKMPYRAAHLTERQAAAHLLNRFSFGARPEDIDMVVKIGLKKWFLSQLDGNIPDDSLNARLKNYPDLLLSNSVIANTFPLGGQLFEMIVKDSIINKDSLVQIRTNKPALYKIITSDFMKKRGLKYKNDLFKELIARKILSAAYSQNQLHEVITDFWFNHFNVSIKKEDCSRFISDFERDAIRPNILGKFQTLLLATAKSPAMLLYLDNFSSAYTDTTKNKPNLKNPNQSKPRRVAGLNENYAREIMELHTLGVDGGYTQSDVTQAARILTGWTIYPWSDRGPSSIGKIFLDKMGEVEMAKKGFVHDGDFIFTPNRHDPNSKTVLGHNFPPGGGYQEGVDLLSLLAHHSSTARFISKELAVRFVSDNPPKNLIDKMANTFLTTDGNIREVIITLVSSPEFWNPSSLRQKTKSPFEYSISAVRGLHSTITDVNGLNYWITRMGEPIYYYLAPTGFPDQGEYWINTGSLLNRMNFGLSLATGKVDGVKTDLLSLNQNHEPESSDAALRTYSSIMLPERSLQETINRLRPLLSHPNLDKKIEVASKNLDPNNKEIKPNIIKPVEMNANSLSQVVGIILGSPEFQRR